MYETDPLINVRDALTTTLNVTGALGSANWGGVEIQKKIDQMIADTQNRGVDLKPLIKRKPLNQLTYFFNIRTNLGSTEKFAVYADGGAGTPYGSNKIGYYAKAISYRSDYEVTNLMLAGSSSYYDALADEAQDALDALKLGEEKMMICGSDTSAYGYASAFTGLLQFMRWNNTNGGDTEGTAANKMADTTSIHGTARSSSRTELDVSYVIAGTVASATGNLELKHLDKAIDLSDNHGGKDNERVFFCSTYRGSEINRLLQPQQRFAGTLNLEGGFSVATYKGIPIITSRYMDKNGATNTSSWDSSTDADNSMYLLDLDNIEFRVLAGVDSAHVTIAGQGDSTNYLQRADAQGGYFKTYGVLVMRRFNTQVHIANLTAPA